MPIHRRKRSDGHCRTAKTQRSQRAAILAFGSFRQRTSVMAALEFRPRTTVIPNPPFWLYGGEESAVLFNWLRFAVLSISILPRTSATPVAHTSSHPKRNRQPCFPGLHRNSRLGDFAQVQAPPALHPPNQFFFRNPKPYCFPPLYWRGCHNPV